VGFTGVDNQGLYGVEKIFDDELKGEEISIIALKDSIGNLSFFMTRKGLLPKRRCLSLR